MYTSSMGVDYNRSKVPHLLPHDSSHKDGTLRYVGTLDTTGDIYASNKNTRLSISLFLDWPLVTDVPTWGGLTKTLT